MPDNEKHIDEEWKKRAEQEKQHDAEHAKEGAAPRHPPQASFPVLVSSVATQVYILLGEIENPMTGKRERDIEQAKFSIDLLQVLKDKTKGNLTEDETKLIDRMLFDLRMRYVRVAGG